MKLFISHGGLIGTQEAIFHGIPIIGIPIFADQFNNLLQVEKAGHGKILNYHDISEQNLIKIINEVLHNNSYKNKAKEIQARFKDRPIPPLDAAIFWIEYVIRHKGANFVKNPAINMSWLASSMFDVYGFILIMVVIHLLIIVKLFRIIRSIIKAPEKNIRRRFSNKLD